MKFSFDFELVTASEMLNLLNIDMSNPEKVIPLFSKVVLEWPYEGAPSEAAAYDNLDFPDVILLVRAVSDAMVQFMSKPQVVKQVNLKGWKWADYSAWRKAAETNDWTTLTEQLSKVAKVDMNKMTGEDYLNLLGSINAKIQEVGSSGN